MRIPSADILGIESLFSDMTHEGARSVLGEYLDLAGAFYALCIRQQVEET